jgi:hypothetical protein
LGCVFFLYGWYDAHPQTVIKGQYLGVMRYKWPRFVRLLQG